MLPVDTDYLRYSAQDTIVLSVTNPYFMESYDLIWNFLCKFFNYEFYSVAVINARAKITSSSTYQENWQTIQEVVQNRKLLPGEPLRLVNVGANQVLDDNSDEEAYAWLDKAIANIQRSDDTIDEY
ncbi:hypothetical protein [Vacuolonema iberomarrocanum]|uniref:hypothetical protein n=1 Tax=Vacuolonema iberomarrocanum TaxID=3454632 RepID=UPI0019E471AA|nr:hypothetical protein [filamentous cyanobacterium LEGE 07170]